MGNLLPKSAGAEINPRWAVGPEINPGWAAEGLRAAELDLPSKSSSFRSRAGCSRMWYLGRRCLSLDPEWFQRSLRLSRLSERVKQEGRPRLTRFSPLLLPQEDLLFPNPGTSTEFQHKRGTLAPCEGNQILGKGLQAQGAAPWSASASRCGQQEQLECAAEGARARQLHPELAQPGLGLPRQPWKS